MRGGRKPIIMIMNVNAIPPDSIRYTRIPLAHGFGALPAVGFGTLIPDPLVTRQAVQTALEVGFRHFDCAERYRNEAAVGEAMQAMFQSGAVRREEVFITTKLWNTNHRPERVRPACDCRLITLIAMSSTPPLPFAPATNKTRGTNTVR
jgi:hypothetical protein